MNDRIEAIRAELEKALEDLGKVRDRLEEIVARAAEELTRASDAHDSIRYAIDTLSETEEPVE